MEARFDTADQHLMADLNFAFYQVGQVKWPPYSNFASVLSSKYTWKGTVTNVHIFCLNQFILRKTPAKFLWGNMGMICLQLCYFIL